jgi:hypothetical protein
MSPSEIYICQCHNCQQEADHPDKHLHLKMNLLMSRFDEQQRRWYAAFESQRVGHGGDRLLSQITGLDEKTIRRGRAELADSLDARPVDRIRLEGAGRPLSEKKSRLWPPR